METATKDTVWLTTSAAARMIGIAEGTLRNWARTGRINVTKTESGWRLFAKDDVDAAAARAFAERIE